MLAQKVATRSARAAVSKIGAEALVSKALSVHVRRAKAGSLLKTIREINRMKIDILVGHRYHTAGSLKIFELGLMILIQGVVMFILVSL